jgi:hypothetical protein
VDFPSFSFSSAEQRVRFFTVSSGFMLNGRVARLNDDREQMLIAETTRAKVRVDITICKTDV